MTYAILEVAMATHDDIRKRIEALGPLYVHDFLTVTKEHGVLIVFGETALAVERKANKRP